MKSGKFSLSFYHIACISKNQTKHNVNTFFFLSYHELLTLIVNLISLHCRLAKCLAVQCSRKNASWFVIWVSLQIPCNIQTLFSPSWHDSTIRFAWSRPCQYNSSKAHNTFFMSSYKPELQTGCLRKDLS